MPVTRRGRRHRPRRVARSVAEFRPDAIVHCAILNDPAALVSRRREAWDAYVGATRNVVEAAGDAQVVLVSTDWVFDGTQGGATEDEPPNPINAYGFLKAASELVVSERAKRGAVARIAGVQGVHRARPERRAPRTTASGTSSRRSSRHCGRACRSRSGRAKTSTCARPRRWPPTPPISSGGCWNASASACTTAAAPSRSHAPSSPARAVDAFELDGSKLRFGPPTRAGRAHPLRHEPRRSRHGGGARRRAARCRRPAHAACATNSPETWSAAALHVPRCVPLTQATFSSARSEPRPVSERTNSSLNVRSACFSRLRIVPR